MATTLYDEPKIDCHCHVLDPAGFAYGADAFYRPSGQEVGTALQLSQMHDAYGVRHGLIVGPNSGYEEDNRCLLDAIERGRGRYKGIAVVANGIGETLQLPMAIRMRSRTSGSSLYSRTVCCVMCALLLVWRVPPGSYRHP